MKCLKISWEKLQKEVKRDMEDKLLDKFRSFCRFNCQHRSKKPINEEIKIKQDGYCPTCDGGIISHDIVYTKILPCDYCEIENFIKECESRL